MLMLWLGERKISGFWPWKNVEVLERWLGLVMLKIFNFKTFAKNYETDLVDFGCGKILGKKRSPLPEMLIGFVGSFFFKLKYIS